MNPGRFTNARMRLYDELLPRLERALDAYEHPSNPLYDDARDDVSRVPEILSVVRRVGAIAGRHERKAVHRLTLLSDELTQAAREDITLPFRLLDEEENELVNLEDEREKSLELIELKAAALRSELQSFSDYLGAKLG